MQLASQHSTPFRRRCFRTTLAKLALAIVVSLFAAACAETTYIDSDVAHDYRISVELGPIQRGWELLWVGRLLDRPDVIAHKVLVQADLAGDLVRMSGGQLRDAVSEVACPSVDHDIWRQIRSNQDVEVELATKKNGPFATISCRAAVH